MSRKKTRVGIGFATGRKSFRRVLETYIYNMQESGLTEAKNYQFDFFIAYDLKYNNTKSVDYTNIHQDLRDMIGDVHFLGSNFMKNQIASLQDAGVVTKEEAALLFASGYAGKRNAVLYEAMKTGMDCLLFLDDDEYPLAVTNTNDYAIWSGQRVLSTHLRYIRQADITNGRHCGYISPIPYVQFNDVLTEDLFRKFIMALSNDIVQWDKILRLMQSGGVTYADKDVLAQNRAEEVPEEGRAKFISGANLCLNLSDPMRTKPFFNPPGARGEDTFLGTTLSDRKVLRVPCYTFHDGFSTYNCLLSGVLPTQLQNVEVNEKVTQRFYRACLGWVRYKPLLLYITRREQYEALIEEMQENLLASLPAVCRYFGTMAFMRVLPELEYYHKNVRLHHKQFLDVQRIWGKLCKP